MKLKSIDEIKNKKNSLIKKIKDADLTTNSSQTYGGENEYNFKGLVGEIDALLTDLSTLTEAPSILFKLSTLSERNQIVDSLDKIETSFDSPVDYLPYFEKLKTLLRGYNVRSFSERQIEFEREIEETSKIKLQLTQELEEANKIREEIESNNSIIDKNVEKTESKLTEIESQLNEITKRKDELVEHSKTLNEINTELEKTKQQANQYLTQIMDSKNNSNSNEKIIDQFAAKVQEREKRFVELVQDTNEYNKKLTDYQKERVKILKDAKELIDSAREALNYNTAVGISASFQSQYDKSDNNWIVAGWIAGAIICLLGTVGLGIWILGTEPDQIVLLIGRISLLPLPIIGAIFCANQYTKQKNIIEDYAYKMVLSKAIVGFSEQLKKNGSETNEEYIHYVKTVLEEIHKDPIRKREKNKESKNEATSLKEVVEMLGQIIKTSKLE